MDSKKIDAMVKALLAQTQVPTTGWLPPPSFFPTEVVDFEIYRRTALKAYEGERVVKYEVCVIHPGCETLVEYLKHRTDDILSVFSCGGCSKKWTLSELRKLPLRGLMPELKTKLVEKSEDLIGWPSKLVEVEVSKIRYSTLRPATLEEVLTSRVKCLLEIRGSLNAKKD